MIILIVTTFKYIYKNTQYLNNAQKNEHFSDCRET
jgi:hypothetical protein